MSLAERNIDPLAQIELQEVEEFEEQLSNPEQQMELRQRFRVTDISSADWCLRKLEAIAKEREAVDSLAKSEIQRISAWQARENQKLASTEQFFQFLLEEYHRQVLAENPKKKTIDLPHGKLQLRAAQPKFEMANMESIISWLKEHQQTDLVRVKEEINVDAFKRSVQVREDGRVLTEDGEMIPNVVVVPQAPKFSVKLKTNETFS